MDGLELSDESLHLSLLDQSIGPGLATAETESRDMIMLLDTDLPTTEDCVLVDSGAVAHVCPPSWALGLCEDLAGEDPQLRTASGLPITYYGDRKVKLKVDGTTGLAERVFHVCDVVVF